jgi:hypothetical protein
MWSLFKIATRKIALGSLVQPTFDTKRNAEGFLCEPLSFH